MCSGPRPAEPTCWAPRPAAPTCWVTGRAELSAGSGLRSLGVLLQDRLQGGHGARGVTLHRAAADLHRGCDLRLGQVRVVTQDDGLALSLGQAAERGDDRAPLE